MLTIITERTLSTEALAKVERGRNPPLELISAVILETPIIFMIRQMESIPLAQYPMELIQVRTIP